MVGFIGIERAGWIKTVTEDGPRFVASSSGTRSPSKNGFKGGSDAWQATRAAVHSAIKSFLSTFTAERRSDAKAVVRQTLRKEVNALPPAGRDRWNEFVERVIDDCPSISTHEVEQIAGNLANLELSNSRYGLINKLHEMPPGDLDQLNQLLADWTIRTAKIALDDIQTRLKLIQELDTKLRDEAMDEVADLQPLFERSLWVFGPEFESIEFTSNKGMTEVIRKIFGVKQSGSRSRPDFVMLPDGSVGLYSRDAHDMGHEVDGVSRLVVARFAINEKISRLGCPVNRRLTGWQPTALSNSLFNASNTRQTSLCAIGGRDAN